MDFFRTFKFVNAPADMKNGTEVFNIGIPVDKPYRRIWCGIQWLPAATTDGIWLAQLEFSRSGSPDLIVPIENEINSAAATGDNVRFSYPASAAVATPPGPNSLLVTVSGLGFTAIPRYAPPGDLVITAQNLILRSLSYNPVVSASAIYLAILSSDRPLP